jgi:Fe-S cluster assembly scaffold protein SufB
MTIHSFLKAEKGDPAWQYSPDRYFNKEFKIIDANLIELPEDVSESLVLRQTPTERQLLAKHLKINVKESSTLELTVINDADPKLEQIFMYDINLEENSLLTFMIFVNGGKLNKHIIQVTPALNASFNLVGLIKNSHAGDCELITKVVQAEPNSENNQFVACISGKGSQTVYQSMTILDDACMDSEAHIEGIGLVADPSGRCFIKPEIHTDSSDVDTSYTAQVRKLDLEQLYYFQTLGIEEADAVNLITNSFIEQAIGFVESPDIQEEIRQIYM